METTSVTRSIDLPVSAAEAWRSVIDVGALSSWLGDDVELDVAVGAAGRMVDGGIARRLVVTRLDDGRRVELAWWDEAAPERVSTVAISVEPGEGDDACTVTVTERMGGGSRACWTEASVADAFDIGHRWDARLDALFGSVATCAAHALV